MDHAAPGTAAWSHAMAGLTARRAPARDRGRRSAVYARRGSGPGSGRRRRVPDGIAAAARARRDARGAISGSVFMVPNSADDTQENYAYAFHERTLITASAFPSKQPNRHRKRVTTHTSGV